MTSTPVKGKISRETFETLADEQKLMIIFDILVNINERIENLEKSKWNKIFSFVGGIVGGALAFLGIKIKQQW